MKTTHLSKALLVAALGSVALIGCKKKEEAVVPPPAPVETTPAPTLGTPAATVAVTGVNLGKDEGVTTAATTFAPTDQNIYAAVATQTSDAAANVAGKLTAKWTHVDSNQVVAEDTKDFSFTGPGVTTFHISKPDGWPTGTYRVEVSLDGNVVNTTDFTVQ